VSKQVIPGEHPDSQSQPLVQFQGRLTSSKTGDQETGEQNGIDHPSCFWFVRVHVLKTFLNGNCL